MDLTLAHWIMLAGLLMPYVIVSTAKAQKGFDNSEPRDAALYDGWRGRAYAAHHNALEAFPIFAAAVLLATVRGADATIVNIAAVVWLVARVLHWTLYVKDKASGRALIWFVGLFAVLAIFGAALFA